LGAVPGDTDVDVDVDVDVDATDTRIGIIAEG
jgi:hypothetical protein